MLTGTYLAALFMTKSLSSQMVSLTADQFLAQFAGLPSKVIAQGLVIKTIHSTAQNVAAWPK